MTIVEIASLVVAAISAVYAFIAHRRINQAYNDANNTVQWLVNKLEKNRYDARKEYNETGWSPSADKQPNSDS